MKRLIKTNIAILTTLMIAMVLTVTSCGGGGSGSGGGGGGGGGATVQGRITTFNGVAFLEIQGQRHMLASLSDALISPAHAVEGVQVDVCGIQAVSQPDGSFVATGVAPGPCLVTFTFDGTAVSTTIVVPANATVVELNDITVGDGVVNISNLEIEFEDEASTDVASNDEKSDDGDSKSSDQTSSEDGDSKSSDQASNADHGDDDASSSSGETSS